MAITAGLIIDVAETFRTLFGYNPAVVPTLPAATVSPNPFNIAQASNKKTTTAKGSPLYGLADMLGREVYMPITLVSKGVSYDFPFCIVGLRNQKSLKRTSMVERGGDVIEEVSTGAWEMDLKGFLIDANNDFPDEQLSALITLYQNNEPVYLKCALTDLALLANDQVVIENLDIPAKAKVIGVRDFSFKMVQDSILDLYKIN